MGQDDIQQLGGDGRRSRREPCGSLGEHLRGLGVPVGQRPCDVVSPLGGGSAAAGEFPRGAAVESGTPPRRGPLVDQGPDQGMTQHPPAARPGAQQIAHHQGCGLLLHVPDGELARHGQQGGRSVVAERRDRLHEPALRPGERPQLVQQQRREPAGYAGRVPGVRGVGVDVRGVANQRRPGAVGVPQRQQIQGVALAGGVQPLGLVLCDVGRQRQDGLMFGERLQGEVEHGPAARAARQRRGQGGRRLPDPPGHHQQDASARGVPDHVVHELA